MGDTTPVDNYLDFENDFGIADTLGNVLEWSYCSATPYSGPNESASYVAKGGSWISGDDLRSYSRFQLEPESRSNLLGFRCVAY
jgi:formylglycine-generating enzyme required for sulfatase activity